MRRRFDKQFKLDAIQMLITSGKTHKVVADELGIPRDALSRWKREYDEHQLKAFPGKGIPRDQELANLRKEIADVKMERDILKKALAIFSNPGNRNASS